MAAEWPVKDLCYETTCPICLDYFKNPVTIDCGHNFCQACLSQCWEESNREKVSCPHCRESFQQRDLRPNRQLANVAELVKLLQAENERKRKRGECEKHTDSLKLFCRDDEDLLCAACDRSKEHQDHNVISVEEAAEVYKVKIQAEIQSLEEEREKFWNQNVAEEQRTHKLLAQLIEEKKKVETIFEQVQMFLDQKKAFWLPHLDHLEADLSEKQEENISVYSDKHFVLCNMIEELKKNSSKEPCEFLQGIKCALSRRQWESVKALGQPHLDLEERFGNFFSKSSMLLKALEKCQESLVEALKKVSVTLDLNTARPPPSLE